MLNVILPPELAARVSTALQKAGRQEVGGALLAEHVGPDEFVVRELTVHKRAWDQYFA